MSIIKKYAVTLLLCGSVLAGTLAAAAVNVASECDISDRDEAIETSVSAAAIGETLDIGAKSAILMEVSSGKILYEMNADEALPPASITKIMSLLLIMEAIDSGRLKLDDTVTASAHAASMGGSQIWLEENETMTVDELLRASVIASANDATVALAESVAGSEEGFVAAMNEKAKELGLNSTHFMNATGLDADGHISTAHDVAVMSKELIKHELIKKYSTVWMESLRGGETELVNTNKLVRFYEGTTGLKTGTTDAAGYCLAATAERDGLSLVAVIMNGNSSADRFNGAKKLLDFGFCNYAVKTVPIKLSKTRLKVKDGEENYVDITAQSQAQLLVQKSGAQEINQKISLKSDLKAPIKKGQQVGIIEILSGDEVLSTLPVTAKNDVYGKSFFKVFAKTLRSLFIL